MSESAVVQAAVPQAPDPRRWTVAIIDDGFVPPSVAHLSGAQLEAVEALVRREDHAPELAAIGVAASAPLDDILDALSHPHVALGLLFAQLLDLDAELGRMIEERQAVRRLATLLQEQSGSPVLTCRPDQGPLPDLTGYDLVLIDYYLEGRTRTPDLSRRLAREVRDQPGRPTDQQVVLMSSVEGVRKHRTEFRQDADLAGAAFAFVSKDDLDERWKVKAHLGMLDRARPHAPALAQYRSALAESLQEATQGLLRLADDLDIGDYAYLQSQALMSDGHPLGDYVSWLLASQFISLAFEGGALRARQRELDRLEFENRTFAATEPSAVVAELFHNALLAGNQGPLAAHPRAKPESDYADVPVVQLGDVFLNLARTQAFVVLSADCDLAFSPVPSRAPDGEKPVILAPGKPVVLLSPEDKNASASTPGVLANGDVYRIDWDFAAYRSVPLGELKAWLEARGLETSNRDRLRPLYALKLQQEFGAHLMRVGPPIMPPLTFAAEGRVYVVQNGVAAEVEPFTDGEVMVSHHKEELRVRMTPKLVDALRRATDNLVVDLETAVAGRTDLKPRDRENEQKKIDALKADLEDDDYWIGLVESVPLGGPTQIRPVRAAVGFVLDEGWASSKPRVIFEVRIPGAARSA